MNNITSYNEFVNEKLLTQSEPDVDAIFTDMVKDFEENGKDIRKAMMIGTGIHYVFGKFHEVNNSPMTGNKQVGNKDVTIHCWKSESIFGRGEASVKIEEKIVNPDYDPNYGHFDKKDNLTDEQRRNKWRIYNEKETRFMTSYKKGMKIVEYFTKAWDEKYPQLKGANYKNLMNITEIERGDDPHLGSVDVRDKVNTEIIYQFTNFEDEKKLKKYIKDHVCIQGKSKEGYPTTYFTKDGESKEDAERFIKNTPKERIERINLERIREYSN